MRLTRRTLLMAATAATLPSVAGAETPLALSWADLIPEGAGGAAYDALRALGVGVVEHGQLEGAFDQDLAARLTHAYDGRRVTLPGFVIPLEFDGVGATTMILAPYVGACIHVPPPPPNQLVLVTAARPFEVRELFAPVQVTGRFAAMAVDAGLAEIGYAIEADRIAPYDG